MSTTLTQLRTLTYALLREEENSSAYPYTLVDQLLNSAQMRICSGQVHNSFNGEAIRKGNLPFLNKRQFVTNIQSTSLSADATIAGATLTVTDTTNFPSTGSLWIAGDIVTYTGKGATSFTGCSGVAFAHLSWTRVYPAFTLATDFMSMTQVSYNNSLPIPYKDEKQVYRDLVPAMKGYTPIDLVQSNTSTPIQYTRVAPFYTLWEGYFVPFFIDNTGWMFCLQYDKVPTELSAVSDTATIDNDIWAKSSIPYLAGGEMLFNRGEGDAAINLLNFAYAQIKEMYAYYNNKASEDIDGQSVTYEKRYFNI